jgi:dynein heavy chain
MVASFNRHQDEGKYEEVAKEAKAIMKKLMDANEQSKKYNQQENMTGEEETNYEVVRQNLTDFTPFYELWTTVETWYTSMKQWKTEDFEKLDAQALEEMVDNSRKNAAKCIKIFRSKDNMAPILKISETIRDKVADFAPQVPIVVALRTEGMKERHWNAISEKVGFSVKPRPGFTLQNTLDMNLLRFEEDIVDIGDKAAKQYQIECQLAKMKTEWETVEFMLKKFKNTPTYTIASFEDPMTLLDDHTVTT